MRSTLLMLALAAWNSGCIKLWEVQYRYVPDPEQKDYQPVLAVEGTTFTLSDGSTFQLAAVDFSRVSPEAFRSAQQQLQILVQKPVASTQASGAAATNATQPSVSRVSLGYHSMMIRGDAPSVLVVRRLEGRAQLVTGGGPEVRWRPVFMGREFPVIVLIPIVVDAPPPRCNVGLALVEQGLAEPRYEDLTPGDRKLYAQALEKARRLGKGSWAYKHHGSMRQALLVSLSSPEKMTYLLEKAPDRPTREDINDCMLYAIDNGKLDTLKFLVSHGGDVNAPEPECGGGTPLIRAAGVSQRWPVGRAGMVRFLLERGAKVNALRKDGYSPLRAAAAVGDAEVVKLLLSAGADPGAKTIASRETWAAEGGQTPLSLARERLRFAEDKSGPREAVKLLEAATKAK